MSRITFRLHGHLRELGIADGIRFEADTMAEAINGLCKMTKAFDVPAGQPRHELRVMGFDTREPRTPMVAPADRLNSKGLLPNEFSPISVDGSVGNRRYTAPGLGRCGGGCAECGSGDSIR